MEKEWVHVKTVTGNVATNEQYLKRQHINNEFWREVGKGNHILLGAPRRAGKTSLMTDLVENCPEDFACIYKDLENIPNKEAFYKQLFHLILQCADRSKFQDARDFISRCLRRYNIKEISTTGITIDSREIRYETELLNIIPEFKDAKFHTVIFLDEFAEVIHKLKNAGLKQDALDILYTLRALRHDENFRHFTIVYAGSISLETVIRQIDRTKLINDLRPIRLKPLTDEEATRLIAQLLKVATIRVPDEVQHYLKEKLEYLLPYYLQLIIEAIDDIAFDSRNPMITTEIVDRAFERVLNEHKNFEDWVDRISVYQEDHFPFINEILVQAAHEGGITVREIYEKAIVHGLTQSYMDFVYDLIQNGYLKEAEKHVYIFASPLLQQFWLKKYPIYHV
jgi:hypothetical protein